MKLKRSRQRQRKLMTPHNPRSESVSRRKGGSAVLNDAQWWGNLRTQNCHHLSHPQTRGPKFNKATPKSKQVTDSRQQLHTLSGLGDVLCSCPQICVIPLTESLSSYLSKFMFPFLLTVVLAPVQVLELFQPQGSYLLYEFPRECTNALGLP